MTPRASEAQSAPRSVADPVGRHQARGSSARARCPSLHAADGRSEEVARAALALLLDSPAADARRYADARASLRIPARCTTLSYMKNASVTIRLDPKLQRELSRLSRQLGRSRSDLVRDALRRQLALVRFEQARRGLLPLAEAKGILSDEDVFDLVS